MRKAKRILPFAPALGLAVLGVVSIVYALFVQPHFVQSGSAATYNEALGQHRLYLESTPGSEAEQAWNNAQRHFNKTLTSVSGPKEKAATEYAKATSLLEHIQRGKKIHIEEIEFAISQLQEAGRASPGGEDITHNLEMAILWKAYLLRVAEIKGIGDDIILPLPDAKKREEDKDVKNKPDKDAIPGSKPGKEARPAPKY